MRISSCLTLCSLLVMETCHSCTHATSLILVHMQYLLCIHIQHSQHIQCLIVPHHLKPTAHIFLCISRYLYILCALSFCYIIFSHIFLLSLRATIQNSLCYYNDNKASLMHRCTLTCTHRASVCVFVHGDTYSLFVPTFQTVPVTHNP